MTDPSAPDNASPTAYPKRRTLAPWLLLLLAVPLLRCCAIEGWVQPIRIAGGSMAGSLYGAHHDIRCADCGIVFQCGAEFVPATQWCVCPNCGFARNQVETANLVPGRRVVTDRWAQWMHGPQMWQSVAFSQQNGTDSMAIKRVVACGSGQVEIRDGDVWVDGHIQQKSLDQYRKMRILVYDDHYRPTRTTELPSRWHGEQKQTRWKTTPSGYVCPTRKGAEPNIDWLEYTQWPCWPHPLPPAARTEPTAIVDHYAYNQNVARRCLSRVDDVSLTCQITVHGPGQVTLRNDNGADCFQLELSYPASNCQLRHNGTVMWHQHLKKSRTWLVELALCDHRVLASVNGTRLLERDFDPAVGPRHIVGPRLAIGAFQQHVEVSQLRIYRDLYYLGPAGECHWLAPQRLGPQQYFVIGDNVPVSFDSRRLGPLDSHAILGPVYCLGD